MPIQTQRQGGQLQTTRNFGGRGGVGGQQYAPTALPRKREGIPLLDLQEAWQVSGPVYKGTENLAPTGIRFRDRLARRESIIMSNRITFSQTLLTYEEGALNQKCSLSSKLTKSA